MLASLTLPVGLALRARQTPAPILANASLTTLSLTAATTPSNDRPDYDRLLLIAWGFASLALAALFGASYHRTLALLRTWRHRDLHGTAVTLSPTFGPATVGLIRSRVVVPDWVLALSDDEQRLVLRHELEHIKSGDQLVLSAGVLLAVLMPWNIPLWWQLRRLRISIELDCDARVALAPRDRPRYANLLLRTRAPRRIDRMALAFFPTRSALGDRLLALLDHARPTRRQIAVWSVSSLACLGALARVPVPNLNSILPHAANAASPSSSNALRARASAAVSGGSHEVKAPRQKLRLVATRAQVSAALVTRTDDRSAVPAHPVPAVAARVRYDALLPFDSTVLVHQSVAPGLPAGCGCARGFPPGTSRTPPHP
ncbi:MAG: M56 family metallopeptidase [Gemmatimonadales bacterium]